MLEHFPRLESSLSNSACFGPNDRLRYTNSDHSAPLIASYFRLSLPLQTKPTPPGKRRLRGCPPLRQGNDLRRRHARARPRPLAGQGPGRGHPRARLLPRHTSNYPHSSKPCRCAHFSWHGCHGRDPRRRTGRRKLTLLNYISTQHLLRPFFDQNLPTLLLD